MWLSLLPLGTPHPGQLLIQHTRHLPLLTLPVSASLSAELGIKSLCCGNGLAGCCTAPPTFNPAVPPLTARPAAGPFKIPLLFRLFPAWWLAEDVLRGISPPAPGCWNMLLLGRSPEGVGRKVGARDEKDGELCGSKQ